MNKPPIVVVVEGGLVRGILGPPDLRDYPIIIIDQDFDGLVGDDIESLTLDVIEPFSNLEHYLDTPLETLFKAENISEDLCETYLKPLKHL